MANDWMIDRERGLATARAWGGVFTASKTGGEAGDRWAVRWESDARTPPGDGEELGLEDRDLGPALSIAAHVHRLDRFGIDAIPSGPEPLATLIECASFNGPWSIKQHLERHYAELHQPFADEPGPSVWLGADPF